MHSRRFATFLLGGWVAGCVFMAMVAAHNLHAVDELLKTPPYAFANQIETIGKAGARALLHFQAAELNGWYFDAWEWAQLGIGVALLATLAARRPHGRLVIVLPSLMLGITVVQHFGLAPALAGLTSTLVVNPLGQPGPDHSRFMALHFTYMLIEAIKLALGLMLLFTLVRHNAKSIPNGENPAARKAVHSRGSRAELTSGSQS